MEPYAQISDAGPFAASADLFTILVEELQSAEAAGLTACELNTMDLGGFSLAWLRDLAFCAALEAERDSW